jgi:hypothetical protein
MTKYIFSGSGTIVVVEHSNIPGWRCTIYNRCGKEDLRLKPGRRPLSIILSRWELGSHLVRRNIAERNSGWCMLAFRLAD